MDYCFDDFKLFKYAEKYCNYSTCHQQQQKKASRNISIHPHHTHDKIHFQIILIIFFFAFSLQHQVTTFREILTIRLTKYEHEFSI